MLTRQYELSNGQIAKVSYTNDGVVFTVLDEDGNVDVMLKLGWKYYKAFFNFPESCSGCARRLYSPKNTSCGCNIPLEEEDFNSRSKACKLELFDVERFLETIADC